MVRNEAARDSLLETEAELEKRQAALLLVEVSELLAEVPDSALHPEQHEELVALKQDTRDLYEAINRDKV